MTSESLLPTDEPAYHRRKDQRPKEILNAALDEFFEFGFAKARMDRIARRAGVSRATLYVYFDNKDALFDAAAQHAVGGLVDETAALAVSFEGTTAELLTQVFRQFYETMDSSRHMAILRVLLAEGRDQPALAQRYHSEVLSRGTAALTKILERGVARGEVRQSAVYAVPPILLSPAIFYVVDALVFDGAGTGEVDTFLQAHVEMVLHGILV